MHWIIWGELYFEVCFTRHNIHIRDLQHMELIFRRGNEGLQTVFATNQQMSYD